MAPVLRSRSRPGRKSAAAVQASHLALAADGTLAGFIFDPEDLGRRFTVEILFDGLVVGTYYATSFVPELSRKGIDDGN